MSKAVHVEDSPVELRPPPGARAVWVFNPKKRTAAVYTSPLDVRVLSEQETLEGGDVLPGFTLQLSKLFAVGKK